MDEEKVKKSLEYKVNQSGLILEEKVSKALEVYFNDIERNAHYLDKEQLKDRDIDFSAKTGLYFIPPNKKNDNKVITLTFQFIIECKRSNNRAWIFSGKVTDRMSMFEKAFRAITFPHAIIPEFLTSEPLPKSSNIYEIIPFLKNKLFTADGYLERPYSNKQDAKQEQEQIKFDEGVDGGSNFLRKAILQVIKATRHSMDLEKKNFENWIPKKKRKDDPIWLYIYQPLIVFEGLMYKTIEKNEKIELEPIKFARIKKEYLSSAHSESEGEIHIVSSDWLDDYLSMMMNTYHFMDTHKDFHNLFHG